MPHLHPTPHPAAAEPAVTGAWGWVRGARTLVFLLVFLLYLVTFMGLVQRLVIFPMAWWSPASAPALFASWIRLQARITLYLLRTLGGVRVTVDGHIPPESALVIMNHQSLIDIPVGLSIMPGPLPLIPGRRRYARGIPGVSAYLRAAGNPLVSQKAEDRKADLTGMLAAAARLEAGDASLLIFPEGHRTKDGNILPFMPGGLHVILGRIQRPVYCVVGDGMWKSRTLKDTLLNLPHVRARVRILGPFQPPANKAEIPSFVEHIRQAMVTTLSQMRQADGR